MANFKGSLKVNFVMNALLTMSSFVFPLISFPYVSRVLLPEGTGKVSFAISVVYYFALVAQLGIPTYGIRACAKVRDSREELTRTVHELFFINVVMSVFAYLVFFGALLLVPRLQEDRVLFLIVSLTLFFNAIGMEWLYKGLEQYTYITIRSIIFKLIAFVGMFLLIHQKSDYVMYGVLSIFASSASSVFNFINVGKYISLKPVGGYNVTRHLKPVAIFFAMSCATTIYTNLDTVMLGFMKTDEDVGYYNAATKIKGILVSIVTSLGVVLLPRASYYIQKGEKEKFLAISRKALNFVFLIALPMMVYFILFAKEGIFFISGDSYGGSVRPMQAIMPTLLFIGLTNIMGIQMLVPMGREKTVLYSEIAGAVVDLIVNILLIPQMASTGAAIGTTAAEMVVWLVQVLALRKLVGDTYRHVHYGLLAVALALGCAASLWVKLLSLGYFLTLMISAILFFGAYALVLTLAREPLVLEIERTVFGKIADKIAEKRKGGR